MSELRINDERLNPIAEKVRAGERLGAQDGAILYASPDLLAIGWLANSVREKMHGNTCFFNVNRHINP
ncbi:MAG: aminofutalosine synthase MqnE, partial [Bryobacteraceae bacterium]